MTERARFDRGPEAPGLARNAVSRWLGDRIDPGSLEDLKLLVSELVTNAVLHQHAKGPIEMIVKAGRRGVRVEVCDPGSGFRVSKVSEPPPDSVGGRGLLIVDRVASRWGVSAGEPTRVWFELDA